MTDKDFQFYCPVGFFEKADAPNGQKRRIGGLVSSESKDREDEVVLQRGLDFSDFLSYGWYNDNHKKEQTDVLGYPESVRYVQKGETLPDGSVAPAAGHWAEGYLLEGYPRADQVWALGQSLHKTGGKRRLGFSIEGRIQRRDGPYNKTIAKARVQHVAITHVPVNTDTGLAILAKSLQLESQEVPSLSHSQAAKFVLDRYPGLDAHAAVRIVNLIFDMQKE